MGNKQADGGVRSYIKTSVDIFFTGESVCCDFCPLLEIYSRKQCRRTGEYIYNSKIRGYYCPLKIEVEDQEK